MEIYLETGRNDFVTDFFCAEYTSAYTTRAGTSVACLATLAAVQLVNTNTFI
jgi:hypothetical protein